MAQITDNKAAWIPYEKAPKFEVGPGPVPSPEENEVVIKVAYAAVNPTDFKMQDSPYVKAPYPFIFGTDVSGTIAQVGSSVTRFEIGQRVIGHCDSLLSLKPSHAGYQNYSTVKEILVSEIPDSLPLANAVVLPLAIDTAATGLFKHLGLPYPELEPKKSRKTILIWGGSSSVGGTAIQLAVAAGWTVATTISAHNEAYAKSLGATHWFDYNSPIVLSEILKLLKPGDLVFDSIGLASTQKLGAEIVSKLGGGKFPTVLWPLPTEYKNVEVVIAMGLDPGFSSPELGDALWRNFIPKALAAGKFQAKPDQLILEGGLERVRDGVDILRKGVSAQKVVIEVAKAE